MKTYHGDAHEPHTRPQTVVQRWKTVGVNVSNCRVCMKQGVAEKEHARLSQPGRAKDWKENRQLWMKAKITSWP